MTTESTSQMESDLDEPRLNILNLQIVPVEKFIFVVRAISDNNLWGSVRQHLRTQGCSSVVMSVEPVEVIQEMLLRQRSGDTDELTTDGQGNGRPGPRYRPGRSRPQPAAPERRLDRFLASQCGDRPHYPPRPPDDWPE